MADKTITVDVPQERVPEFYAWFAQFLGSEPGAWSPRRGRGGLGRHGGGHGGRHDDPAPWTTDDGDAAAWLATRLSEPARELFDILIASPGQTFPGNELATRLRLEKGAHGLAGILAWPGRWCRKLGREFPIVTTAREDGETLYSMPPETAAIFATATRGA